MNKQDQVRMVMVLLLLAWGAAVLTSQFWGGAVHLLLLAAGAAFWVQSQIKPVLTPFEVWQAKSNRRS